MEKYFVSAAMMAFCLFLLRTEGLLKKESARFITFGVLLAAFAARLYLSARVPADMTREAEEAIAFFARSGGFWGLKESTCRFAIPVQYFLAFFSCMPKAALGLYQSLCVFFEIVMAWAAQRCVQTVTVRSGPRLTAFLVILLLPSGLFQGAGAAMGDSLWWAFILLAAAAALESRFLWCVITLSLSVAFHPAAIWVVPVFWAFPCIRKAGWKSPVLLVVFYLAAMTPAILLGRLPSRVLPFYPAITSLFEKDAFHGAPGLYAFRDGWPGKPVGIIIYAALVTVLQVWMGNSGAIRDRRSQLCALCFSSLSAATFLPWMPVEALYGAEALFVACCCIAPALVPAAIACSFASALAILCRQYPEMISVPLAWGTVAAFGSLLWLGFYLMGRNARRKSYKT